MLPALVVVQTNLLPPPFRHVMHFESSTHGGEDMYQRSFMNQNVSKNEKEKYDELYRTNYDKYWSDKDYKSGIDKYAFDKLLGMTCCSLS